MISRLIIFILVPDFYISVLVCHFLNYISILSIYFPFRRFISFPLPSSFFLFLLSASCDWLIISLVHNLYYLVILTDFYPYHFLTFTVTLTSCFHHQYISYLLGNLTQHNSCLALTIISSSLLQAFNYKSCISFPRWMSPPVAINTSSVISFVYRIVCHNVPNMLTWEKIYWQRGSTYYRFRNSFILAQNIFTPFK